MNQSHTMLTNRNYLMSLTWTAAVLNGFGQSAPPVIPKRPINQIPYPPSEL